MNHSKVSLAIYGFAALYFAVMVFGNEINLPEDWGGVGFVAGQAAGFALIGYALDLLWKIAKGVNR